MCRRSRSWVLAMLAGTCLTMGAPPPVAGQATNDDIRSSKHNLSASSRDPSFNNLQIADYGEVCVYCHTPHGGQTSAPLWNRAFGVGPYQTYSSPTIDMTIGAPSGVSLACLSCHDGTIGIDVITNPPNSSTATPTGRTLATIYPSGADAFKNLGTDLRNDHPISVTYDPTRDPMFQPLASVKTAGLKFYGLNVDEVQCATCHNPHNKTNVPFLRVANQNSNLCLTCHIK